VGLTDDLLDRMVKQKVYWCPTMFVLTYVAPRRAASGTMSSDRKAFGPALERALRIDLRHRRRPFGGPRR